MPKPTKPTRTKPAAKATAKPATKHPHKKSAAAAPAGAQIIDSTAAASAAAAIVGHKITLTSTGQNTTESSSFKNLKDSLTKPHAQTMGGLLDKITSNSQKKTSNAPFTVGKQVAHNQTVGADASRRSVPRRTGG